MAVRCDYQRRHGALRLPCQRPAPDVGGLVDLVIWITLADEFDIDDAAVTDRRGCAAPDPRGRPATGSATWTDA
ncbi:MAG: hypothetical protein F4Z76_06220 [Rhodothermaceae bacterium]|nr:hypothetical protein [Rhodothermaceae bacterium]